MQDDVSAMVRAQAMELFRQQGLRFTMQQVAEPLHISKKTIYTVYPSKEELLLSMVDAAFEEIHRCKQKILESDGLLLEKLRAVIIAMPEEYSALDLQQMKELEEKYPAVAVRVRDQLEMGWEPTRGNLTDSWFSTGSPLPKSSSQWGVNSHPSQKLYFIAESLLPLKLKSFLPVLLNNSCRFLQDCGPPESFQWMP